MHIGAIIEKVRNINRVTIQLNLLNCEPRPIPLPGSLFIETSNPKILNVWNMSVGASQLQLISHEVDKVILRLEYLIINQLDLTLKTFK